MVSYHFNYLLRLVFSSILLWRAMLLHNYGPGETFHSSSPGCFLKADVVGLLTTMLIGQCEFLIPELSLFPTVYSFYVINKASHMKPLSPCSRKKDISTLRIINQLVTKFRHTISTSHAAMKPSTISSTMLVLFLGSLVQGQPVAPTLPSAVLTFVSDSFKANKCCSVVPGTIPNNIWQSYKGMCELTSLSFNTLHHIFQC